jgi:hypothetical protein
MLKNLTVDGRYRVALTALALVGISLVIVATSKYGAGVSSDAARNLSTADSLMAGRGFVDMVGAPLVLWPPLYPLLLAGLSWLTRIPTFEVAWYLNVLMYGLNIWLAGWWLYVVFRDRPFYAITAALALVLSRSMLRIHANVASEPLFEALILAFFLAAARYLKEGSAGVLWAMCLAAGLGALQRYLGVALLALAAIVILERDGLQTLPRAVLPWLVSAAPLGTWILLHNLPISGALFGPRELGAMLPLQNISLGLTKILWWFAPRWRLLDWLILRPWIPIALLAVVLTAINSRRNWLSWLRGISSQAVWPAVFFAGVYFLLLAFTVVTADHLDLTSDRYYIILLPVVLVLIGISLDTLVLSHFASGRRTAVLTLAGLFAIWCIYPVFAMQSYLRQALVQGEPTNYNIANSAHFREMSVVKAAEEILRAEPDALVYSNYLNIVWFIFDHPVQPLPYQDASISRAERLTSLAINYPGWPDKPGYLVWFTPNQYHHIVAPDELATIADLELLFEDESGQVFAVHGPAR